MSNCEMCGRDDGHHLGCRAIERPTPPTEAQCARDDCPNPRAVSKGPRPAKYCDEHKTGSKK